MAFNMIRVYNDNEKGVRVFVDRVWPRGVSKEKAELDYWLKEVGPTKSLRQWFDHDPEKIDTFKEKYLEELQTGEQREAFDQLKEIEAEAKETTWLVYAAKDETYNHVVILKEALEKGLD
ncbi:DUF488 domain-containing protein [Staphylococcus massiliensis]|uniref:Uroporphyrin-III C-methyltransferase n=1 Tax=Staphylococcus massiliensis S46 TaxID=1229783 RepID=K9B8E1_9STAP|nr:DUF488 family protein [Staphylococcus massiliensis]EKU50010.1 hypothetical protein C273_02038 [Staphylococcus massiliensis S46]MCG3402281.1 DUF488 family protein [Staphylococcus massiliensis]MCG3413421.1 DUF488 family protein [Staphylococcus massiliensis]POA00570.1 DUF488 domain-containing protein [Staphylococcus massiliensis CCUG 55927]